MILRVELRVELRVIRNGKTDNKKRPPDKGGRL